MVDAAGAWVRHVAELAAARVPVSTVRHQLLITAPLLSRSGGPDRRVVDAAVYLRPARRLMVGGFEPDPLPVDRGTSLPRSPLTTSRWTLACCGG